LAASLASAIEFLLSPFTLFAVANQSFGFSGHVFHEFKGPIKVEDIGVFRETVR
jgi:hypothetical protein